MTEATGAGAVVPDRSGMSLLARLLRRRPKAGPRAFNTFRHFPRMLPFVRPHWGLATTSFGMIGFGVLFGLAAPWPMAIVIDSVLGRKPLPGLLEPILGGLSRYQLLAVVVIGSLVLTGISHGLGILDNYVNTKLNLNLTLDFKRALYAHTQRLSLGFHDRIPQGQINFRLGNQAGSIGQIMVQLPPLLQSAITIVGTLVIAVLIDWQLAVLALVIVPLLIYSTRVYATKVEPRIVEVRELQAETQSMLLEGISMMRVIMAFGRERHEFDRWSKQAKEANVALVNLTVRQTIYGLIIGMTTAAGTALILGVGALNVIQGRLTLGELVVLLGYIGSIYAPLASVSSTFIQLQQQFINFESSLALFDTPIEVAEAPGALTVEKARGRVTYDHVGFAYRDTAYEIERRMRRKRSSHTVSIDPAVEAVLPENSSRRMREILSGPGMIDLYLRARDLGLDVEPLIIAKRDPVLIDISFDVQPGQHVAVVGPTGAGKTTLLNLLMRFYDPPEGVVLLDGVDVRRLTLASLREQIGVVPQEPLLFGGTIAENIRYGKLGASDDEVEAAARAANIHDFISNLPDDYETVIGERGSQVSGGERQRISVARAFLKDAPIVVLDEPTSSIDSQTEAVILAALDRLTADRTTFTIAHRLSTVRRADVILVLDHGRLVQQGRHDDLLADGGLYRKMHDLQFGLAAAPDGDRTPDQTRRVAPGVLLFANLLLTAFESLVREGSTAELRSLADAYADRLTSGSLWTGVGAVLAALRDGSDVRAYTRRSSVPWPLVHRFKSVADSLCSDSASQAVCARLRPALTGTEPLDPELTVCAPWTQVEKLSPAAAEVLAAYAPIEGPMIASAERRRGGRPGQLQPARV